MEKVILLNVTNLHVHGLDFSHGCVLKDRYSIIAVDNSSIAKTSVVIGVVASYDYPNVNNDMSDALWEGINIKISTDIIVPDYTIIRGCDRIYLMNSSSNFISNNLIKGVYGHGAYINWDSRNNN